jgi:hypothetical protein
MTASALRILGDRPQLAAMRSDREDSRAPSIRHAMERSEGVTHILELVMGILARPPAVDGRVEQSPCDPSGVAAVGPLEIGDLRIPPLRGFSEGARFPDMLPAAAPP